MLNETNELKVRYDEKKDVLDVSIGDLNDGFFVELEPNFTIKLSLETGNVIGYTIKEYSHNVHKNKIWSEKLATQFQTDNYNGAFYGKLVSKNKKVA